MSYGNLALYDYGLLNGIDDSVDASYLCSTNYNYKPLSQIKVYPLFKYHEKKGLCKIFSYVYSLIRTLLLILQEKPGAIHIQWCKVPYVDFIFMKLLRIFSPKTKIIYTAHNVLPHSLKKGDVYIYTKLYSEVDYLITHTERSKDELVALCPTADEKLNVIPHGLIAYDTDEVEVDQIITDLVLEHDLKDKTVFLAIGRQHKSKGVDILINSWNKVCGNDEDSTLIIAGINNEYEELCTSSNILTFSKYLSNEEFNAFLKISSVIVLPYRKVSQSGVLLSAIEMEKPLIVSNVGGLRDPFTFGNIGWVFDIHRLEEFDLILEIIKNEKSVLTKIENNKIEWEKVKKEYTWDTIQEKTVSLYNLACDF